MSTNLGFVPFPCSICCCRHRSIEPDPHRYRDDAMCGASHMIQGKAPAQCTRECIKEGSEFALASGGKVYTLKGDKSQLDR